MNFKNLSFCFFLLLQINISNLSDVYFSSVRFYDQKIGRFINVDTVAASADSQGNNRFAYAFNNPFKHTDPDGHVPQDYQKGTSEFVGQISEAAYHFANSDQGFFDKLEFGFRSYAIAEDYRDYLLHRIVDTGVFFIDHNAPDWITAFTISPDEKNHRVVQHAFQTLAGDQARIRIRRDYGKPGQKYQYRKGISFQWRVTYQLTAEGVSNEGPKNESWDLLQSSLNSSISSLNRDNMPFLIDLISPDSDSGKLLQHVGLTGYTSQRKDHYLMNVLDDGQRGIRLSPSPPVSSPLSVNLGHQLKHAQDLSQGKSSHHFDSVGHYIFNDDPAYRHEIVYRQAYNQGRPEFSQTPAIPSHIGGTPSNYVTQGYGIRAVFKSIGIHPTTMKPKEK